VLQKVISHENQNKSLT